MTNGITGLITTSFGISNQMLWWAVIGCASLALTLCASLYFRSYLLSMLVMPIPFVFGIIWGYIPIWIGLMLPMPFIMTMLYAPQGETVESENIKPYWEQYGENLKNAYAAKFGGANSGFNQEVDAHVQIMINNGRGFTKTLANDWIKRMAKFTECK